jgi:hypothetical protein
VLVLLSGSDSVFRQVVIELPLRHLRDVLLPLLPFCFEEVRGDVLAQRIGDDLVFLELVARLLEIVRQIVDLQPTLLAV